MNISNINNASQANLKAQFLQCCTSKTWAVRMLGSRPYANSDRLFAVANSHWKNLSEEDYLQAFDGHPKIGDVSSLREKYANTKKLAAGEQSEVDKASDKVLEQLAHYNDLYQKKFGFIFIVCATGKSAAEMLELLLERINNDRELELINAAEEQRKIFQIRLKKLVESH